MNGLARPIDVLLGVRRALGFAAPADGLCTWACRVTEQRATHDEVRYEDATYRCARAWGHAGAHIAKRRQADE